MEHTQATNNRFFSAVMFDNLIILFSNAHKLVMSSILHALTQTSVTDISVIKLQSLLF